MTEKENAGEEFVLNIGRYLSLVRGDVHVRRTRVAMFWSAISLFYIVGGLHVGVADPSGVPADASILWGLAIHGITQTKLLIFLFIMTLYYSVRLIFSVLMINGEIPLRSFRKELRAYKEAAEADDLQGYFQDKDSKVRVHRWLHYRLPDIYNFPILRDRAVTPLSEKELEKLENKNAVRNTLKNLTLSGLENFYALIVFPLVVCGLSFLAFAVVAIMGAVKLIAPFFS